MKLKFWYIQKDNMVYPPFYYGYCWFNFMESAFIYAIWPCNIFIRLWHILRKIQDDNRHFHGCRDRSEQKRRERELVTALRYTIEKYDAISCFEFGIKDMPDKIDFGRKVYRKYR